MKKLTNFIRSLLSVSPSEAKGVVIIFSAIILLILLMFFSEKYFSNSQQSLIISSPQMLDSMTVVLDRRKPHYQDNFKGNTYYKNDFTKKSYKSFPFDPNTVSISQLEELGLPKFIAERVEKYRNKGGKFRNKEDFARIYGLLPETYERLEPYITLPSAENESLHTPQAEIADLNKNSENYIENKGFDVKTTEVNQKFSNKLPTRFDLNTADTTILKSIKGIGSGYAKRIIKYRELLGGFVNPEQIRETYGLPPETADEILKFSFVKGGFRKIKINQVSLSEFRHPYLKYFQVKAIIAYRDQHGVFKSSEDLKQIKILEPEVIEKILPYIEW